MSAPGKSVSRRSTVNTMTIGLRRRAALVAGLGLLGGAALGSDLKSLTVCADPGLRVGKGEWNMKV